MYDNSSYLLQEPKILWIICFLKFSLLFYIFSKLKSTHHTFDDGMTKVKMFYIWPIQTSKVVAVILYFDGIKYYLQNKCLWFITRHQLVAAVHSYNIGYCAVIIMNCNQRIILVASKFLQVKSPNIRELQNLFVYGST